MKGEFGVEHVSQHAFHPVTSQPPGERGTEWNSASGRLPGLLSLAIRADFRLSGEKTSGPCDPGDPRNVNMARWGKPRPRLPLHFAALLRSAGAHKMGR
jgi:hypothetical protein